MVFISAAPMPACHLSRRETPETGKRIDPVAGRRQHRHHEREVPMRKERTRRFLLALGASALALRVFLPCSDPATAQETKVRMTTGLRATSHSIAWIGTE